jgi:hypothetical protein
MWCFPFIHAELSATPSSTPLQVSRIVLRNYIASRRGVFLLAKDRPTREWYLRAALEQRFIPYFEFSLELDNVKRRLSCLL